MASADVRAHVLSVQSSVCFGHVGNSAAVFPMQYRGVSVAPLHTLQFSSHVGYACGFAGTRIPAADIAAVLRKLSQLGGADAPPVITHVVTGYIAETAVVGTVAEFVRDLKARAADAFFLCDPVCGDEGRLYVAQAVADAIRAELVPLADAIVPNGFEAGFLSGIEVVSHESACAAARKLHALGPRIVVISSYSDGVAAADDAPLFCVLSIALRDSAGGPDAERFEQIRFAIPRVAGHFVGTGDLFAALLLSDLVLRGGSGSAGGKDDGVGQVASVVRAVHTTLDVMVRVVRDTAEYAPSISGNRELRIVQNRRVFELDGSAAAPSIVQIL
jgi:pyridoxine kinase